jgi:N-acyl-D-amino-acid deacylase
MVGIDSSMVDLSHESKSPPWSKPLYRAFSAYPSFLNRYVKEQRLFTIEEAIRKCTSLPADTHYLQDRGTIKEGNYADILLLDWENLRFLSTPKETRRYPEGIEHVIVNGETVVAKSKHTGARPGKILTRDTK